jgi:hypothetical protein
LGLPYSPPPARMKSDPDGNHARQFGEPQVIKRRP